jgi:hypothetical protein
LCKCGFFSLFINVIVCFYLGFIVVVNGAVGTVVFAAAAVVVPQ